MNRAFARAFGIDLSECEGRPADYPSLSAFFVRPLRPGARPLPEDPSVPVSPVDGIVGACGSLEDGRAVHAKGIDYAVAALLGERTGRRTAAASIGVASAAERFRSGLFVTIYLSPRHYHRVHAPVSGRLVEARAIPGRLLPVGPRWVRSVSDLFPENERLVAVIGHESLDLALVAVGAFNVGRISAAFDPAWNRPHGRGVTNQRGTGGTEVRRYDPPRTVERGEEIMAFHLGSTVVLLLGARGDGLPEPVPGLGPGEEVRMGAPLLTERLPQ